MIIAQNLSIDPPANEDEFEHWCLWLAREKYGPDVFLYSRKKQFGIDIYWLKHGKYFVIQCKLRTKPGPAELIRSLEADFASAQEHFGANLEQFVFASTITLEQASQKVQCGHGHTECLLDAVGRLGAAHNVATVCWHWDGIAKDVANSPFLMAHLRGLEKGGEIINGDFFAGQNQEHGSDSDLKQAFYGGKKAVQWRGIVQQLDAPRQAYQRAKEAIRNSFSSDKAVAALIKGDGGSGKSVLLRRLAHDLCAEYTIYWLQSDIQSFLDCEWTYDVLKHSNAVAPPKYLLFLEDWYQHVENSQLQKEAVDLLTKAGKTSHVRLVIGDRPARPGAKKAYESHISSATIFTLDAGENVALLDVIFRKMPAWKAKASEEQIKNAAHATLFQLLFIFQYAEALHGNIADVYKRIIESDCRALLRRSEAFWQGMAKAVFFYANVYVHEGVFGTVEFVRDLAAYVGYCDIPVRYSTAIDELTNDTILKKYLGLDSINSKYAGVVNHFRFHHDTMADSGWVLLGDLVGEQYNETVLQAVLESFKDKYPWIVGATYYRQSRLSGNKGMEAARSYLNMSHPERIHYAFTTCLNKLRNEPLAKAKAREFLKTEIPWENHSSFTVCLDLLKTEDLAKDKARGFLKTEIPWENPSSFNV